MRKVSIVFADLPHNPLATGLSPALLAAKTPILFSPSPFLCHPCANSPFLFTGFLSLPSVHKIPVYVHVGLLSPQLGTGVGYLR